LSTQKRILGILIIDNSQQWSLVSSTWPDLTLICPKTPTTYHVGILEKR
jgi:hypothetical protein